MIIYLVQLGELFFSRNHPRFTWDTVESAHVFTTRPPADVVARDMGGAVVELSTPCTGPWLVRLGSKRGAGEYVQHGAAVCAVGIICWSVCVHQSWARRFHERRGADVYAGAFGGRVVRLRERGR